MSGRRRLITGDDVRRADDEGRSLTIDTTTVITPAARDVAAERNISLEPSPVVEPGARPATIAIGADHGGVALKEQLVAALTDAGHTLVDCGTTGPESVDYPVFAARVAEEVARGAAEIGIMVDGAGIGSAMVANKIPGVRAAMCVDITTARNARQHNHANVLTLGGGLIGPAAAHDIVTTFLTTAFGGDRHARRVAMIDALDGVRMRPESASFS